MVAEGTVSTRGLKPDAYVFDEMVFDVNTEYFERHGGYEYAKKFYAEAYELAKQIAGGEQYVISAVMHADERNREASDRLGKDVFHYHMHVIYLPVVEKEIRWSKRCRDPALRGTVRETVMQVSHSKKWPMVPATDETGRPFLKKDGRPRLISSYSLLQTAFYEHMKAAGFTDFERGIEEVRRSTWMYWNTRSNRTGRLCRNFGRKSETWVHRRKKPENSGMNCAARLQPQQAIYGLYRPT